MALGHNFRKMVAKTANKLKNTFNSKKSSFGDFFYNQKNQPKRRIIKNSCIKRG